MSYSRVDRCSSTTSTSLDNTIEMDDFAASEEESSTESMESSSSRSSDSDALQPQHHAADDDRDSLHIDTMYRDQATENETAMGIENVTAPTRTNATQMAGKPMFDRFLEEFKHRECCSARVQKLVRIAACIALVGTLIIFTIAIMKMHRVPLEMRHIRTVDLQRKDSIAITVNRTSGAVVVALDPRNYDHNTLKFSRELERLEEIIIKPSIPGTSFSLVTELFSDDVVCGVNREKRQDKSDYCFSRYTNYSVFPPGHLFDIDMWKGDNLLLLGVDRYSHKVFPVSGGPSRLISYNSDIFAGSTSNRIHSTVLLYGKVIAFVDDIYDAACKRKYLCVEKHCVPIADALCNVVALYPVDAKSAVILACEEKSHQIIKPMQPNPYTCSLYQIELPSDNNEGSLATIAHSKSFTLQLMGGKDTALITGRASVKAQGSPVFDLYNLVPSRASGDASTNATIEQWQMELQS